MPEIEVQGSLRGMLMITLAPGLRVPTLRTGEIHVDGGGVFVTAARPSKGSSTPAP